MSLIELTLENPAYKRVIESPSDTDDTSDTGDEPDAEVEDTSTETGGSRRRPSVGIAVVVAAVVAALAIKRRRS